MSPPIQLNRDRASKDPNARWDAFNQWCAFAGDSTALTPLQRAAYLSYWYATRVEMGGHEDYFSAAPRLNHDEVIAALQTIGAVEQAAILTAAQRAVVIATARAPDDYADRSVAGVEFADFTEFDDAFERCTKSVSACLMDYLEKHESEFIEWKE